MKTTKGKLRNITTGILHTNMTDVYIFLEDYLGAKGIMTHQLPSACCALQPFLRDKLSKEWFTEEWIKTGLDEIVEVPELTKDERDGFWTLYAKYATEMWDAIKDKTIIVSTEN